MKYYPTLQKVVHIDNSVTEVINKLHLPSKKFEIKNNGSDFFAVAIFSMGIGMSVENNWALPIKTKISLQNISNDTTKVSLITEPRIEIVFLCVLWLFFIIFQFFNSDIPFAINFIFPLVILWFGFIFRTQEQILHAQIIKHLNT